jgi:hypothetical protein
MPALRPCIFMLHPVDMEKAEVGGKLCTSSDMDRRRDDDGVDRNVLSAKLEGLAAHSTSTLRSLYEATQCIVKAHQGTHAPLAPCRSMPLFGICPLGWPKGALAPNCRAHPQIKAGRVTPCQPTSATLTTAPCTPAATLGGSALF